MARAAIREDRFNEVVFHEKSWCPPSAADFDACYDKTLRASTRVRPYREHGSSRDGEILEADIEVNGVSFEWSSRGERAGTLSLELALIHELGHVLGLDHPCWPGKAKSEGGAHPNCDDPRVRHAVMHPNPDENLAGRDPGPLPAEVNTICQSHAGSF